MSAQRTGIENYLHHLLPHLNQAWSALPGERTVAVFTADPTLVDHLEPPARVLRGGGRGWTQLRLAPALRDSAASVFFNPIPILPMAGGLPCPAVVTVHDLHEFRPRWWYFRRLLARTLAQASQVVCVSQSTREELVEEFPWAESKCVVVREAADEAVFHPGPPGDVLLRLGIEASPLLALGTLQPRKNYDRLIEAYARLGVDAPPLVIVGKPGWGYESILATPERHGVEGRVRFTGHLDEADVADLMRASVALCAVSTAEGFGLPVVEAMCCGLPVLAADIPPFREVAGTSARFVNPLSVDHLAAGLQEVLGDREGRARMAEAGLARRSLFSWQGTAAEIAEVLERA
jgi:glycosyltransferase involved in cell wall biosynthesis